MIIEDNDQLTGFCTHIGSPAAIGLDTEFLRERTYYAQLCLLQLGVPDQSVCVDTLKFDDLAPLKPVMNSTGICKVIHSARQDLEVLWPAVGTISNIFDTQVAAALIGLPAQVGYAQLCRDLLGVTLAKAQTRTDWSQRPLSAAQIDYALDDARYLVPLHDRLRERLQQLDRLAWFEEEMGGMGAAETFIVDPDQAFRRLKGISDLDPQRQGLAQALAAWRERRAMSSDRPRNWILPDAALRDLVLHVPRTQAQLAAIAELPEGIRNHSGPQLLQLIDSLQLPTQLPPLPQRRRPDPAQVDTVRKLAQLTQRAGQELHLAPEILATRRDMERLAAGARDGAPMNGWRRAVIGERLLEAL